MIISDKVMRPQNWEEGIIKAFCDYLGGFALLTSSITFRPLPALTEVHSSDNSNALISKKEKKKKKYRIDYCK